MRRVLSIDGGGIKGVFPAAFLSELESHVERIGDYFDLICGTSTGGIIALGLAAGFPATEILELYRERGHEIFPRPRRGTWMQRIVRAKYDPRPLKAALESKFGALTLDDCRTRVVVPAQHLASGEVYVYKTAHHPDLVTDGRRRLVDVALATCAAPTFFPSHRGTRGARLVDGGMWANNPAGVAAVEAVGKLGWGRGDVLMLSLGCTEEPLDMRRVQEGRDGLASWIPVGLPFVMAGQSSGAMGMATVLLGSKNIIRCSRVVAPGTFAFDAASTIEELADLGHVEARKAAPEIISRFLQAPADLRSAPS